MAYLYHVDCSRVVEIDDVYEGNFQDLYKQALNDVMDRMRDALFDPLNTEINTTELLSAEIIKADEYLYIGYDDTAVVVTEKEISNSAEMQAFFDSIFDNTPVDEEDLHD